MARKPHADPPSDLTNENIDTLPVVDEAEAVGNADAAPPNARDESSETLEEQLRAAQERAERAEREAAELRQRNGQQEVDLFQTQRAVIDRAIGEADKEKADIRRQIVEAKQVGDYEKEVELLDQISQINDRLGQLKRGKNDLDIRAEQMKDIPTDPVEAYVQSMQPAAREWVRAHPEVVTDPVRNAELTAAHHKALRGNLRAGTPEYFQYLEVQMGYSEDRQDEPPRSDPPPRSEAPRNSQRPPAAPVSRDNGISHLDLPAGVTRRSDGSYRLTPEQYDAARISGVSPAVYLQQLLAIQKERGGSSIN